MQLNRKPFRSTLGMLVMIFALAVMSAAQEMARQSSIANINIKNFGQMDERVYRCAQAKQEY